jgi:hypothetical protein
MVRKKLSDRADANGLKGDNVNTDIVAAHCHTALHCTVRTVDPSVQLLSDPLSVF